MHTVKPAAMRHDIHRSAGQHPGAFQGQQRRRPIVLPVPEYSQHGAPHSDEHIRRNDAGSHSTVPRRDTTRRRLRMFLSWIHRRRLRVPQRFHRVLSRQARFRLRGRLPRSRKSDRSTTGVRNHSPRVDRPSSRGPGTPPPSPSAARLARPIRSTGSKPDAYSSTTRLHALRLPTAAPPCRDPIARSSAPDRSGIAETRTRIITEYPDQFRCSIRPVVGYAIHATLPPGTIQLTSAMRFRDSTF